MRFASLIELAGKPEHQQLVPDEAGFKQRWHAITDRDPFNCALHCGLIADRLSWVFVGAYQSAVRACFPALAMDSWLCFAVSEDSSGTLAGTKLAANRLSGTKTWIAAVDQIDGLLVTIGPSTRNGIVLLPRSREGIRFSSRPRANFLGDMTQGSATFENVQINQDDWLSSQGAEKFAIAEASFVTTAACGYLLKESLRLGDQTMTRALEPLFEDLQAHMAEGHAHNPQQLLALYKSCGDFGKHCATKAADLPGQHADDWAANGRLLGLYRRLLQQAAGADT